MNDVAVHPVPTFGSAGFRLMTVLMNLAAYPLMVLWTQFSILCFLPLFLLWKLVTRWPAERIMRLFVWLYGRGWLLIMSPFVRFEREGMGSDSLIAPAILVVNHLSFFDTYCMALLPRYNVNFAVRAWPFKMFFYAFFMRLAGYLDVESMDWNESLAAGRRILAQPALQLFFPEGHRSRDRQLQRFYSGAFRLATETGTPLIPLCITGTDTLLPPGRWWLQPARIRLRALDPVDPADFPGPTGHVEMRKVVKQMMQQNLDEMRGMVR